MTAVRVQDHPSFGRAAFAQRAYRQGEVIIREPPLLITEPDNKLTIKCLQLVSGHGTSDELEDGSRVDPSFLGGSIEQFMAWCMATPEVQKKVLDDMYNTPNLEQMATSFVISSTKSGLFELGSKLAHTCSFPNTKYKSFQFDHGAEGYHVAMRDISEGELLTTSYVEILHATWSKPARQWYLQQHFAFVCTCERCLLPEDDFRDLPCPRCVPRDEVGRLPIEAVVDNDITARPKGVLRFQYNAAGERSATDSDLLWRCKSCGARFRNSDAELFGALTKVSSHKSRLPPAMCMVDTCDMEARMFSMVRNLDREMTQTGIGDIGKVGKILAVVGRTIGCDHFIYNRALLLHSEVMLSELRGIAMKLDIEVRMGGRRFLQLMDCANNCVSEVEDDWARVWHWLGLRGHFQLQLNRMGFPLHERLVFEAKGLMDIRALLCDVLSQAGLLEGPGIALTQSMSALASLLLERAWPSLEIFRSWQTPEPYGKVVQAEDVRSCILRTDPTNQPQRSYQDTFCSRPSFPPMGEMIQDPVEHMRAQMMMMMRGGGVANQVLNTPSSGRSRQIGGPFGNAMGTQTCVGLPSKSSVDDGGGSGKKGAKNKAGKRKK